MINRNIASDLLDSAVLASRRDREINVTKTKTYATALNATQIDINGVTYQDFLVYSHVGALETDDVVEIEHNVGKKQLTVIGKVYGKTHQLGQTLTAYKTANETVTSSTVAQNDDHLSLSVIASAVYTVEAYFILSGDDANDFQYQFTFPTSATLAGGQINMLYSLAGGANTSGDGDWRALSAQSSPSTALNVGIPDTNGASGLYKGTLVVGANAGTLQLQWAQVTSGLTATTLYAGSTLSIRRIA